MIELKKFGEVCDFVRGPFGGSLKKSCFVEEGYAVYEQQHAIYNQFSDIRYFVTEDKFNEMKRFELKPNDLIMSCSGTMGKVAIVPEGIQKGIINQALLKLTPKDFLDIEYLKYWMSSPDFDNRIEENTVGAAIKNVASVKILKQIDVPVPPLEEQKKIVAILDDAFEAIDQVQANIAKNIENAKELFQSKLNEIFSQKGEGWEEKSLGEVSTVLNGFAFKSKDTVTHSDTQLLRMGNLYKNVLDLTRNPVFYPDKFATDYNKYVLNAGDLIMSLTGTVDKTDYGYTVEVPETNIHLLLNQRIMKIDVIDEDALDKKFLRHYLQSKTFLETLYATASGTRQANLSSKTILTLVINFPKDLAKQEELVYLIEALKDFTLNLEIDYQQKLTNLEDLKKSLLEKAFAGELTHKDMTV
ncbi:restriction endonuclease subunit S [Psychrobacter sp. N25K4-3-2]|uniref:restriction endonuclease subunit S n=1 Tax=Psychrobacter sp. N25K4-3-2 TaxID=2785026 RepID=UPI00188A85BB|nr:restriction endonuclease subunit S [Psychrobacter sp. N25K4-3-2]MBF4489156.1 restriction endonuclease subunit S [Psychrobacter sp. N25K4-3-2]